MARRKKRRSEQKPALPNDFWANLPKSRQHIVCLLFLFILPVLMFHETIIGGYQYFAHDTLQWRAGAESAIEYRESENEEPLWVPNMFAGMPAYVVTYAKAVPHLDQLVFNALRPIFPAAPFWILLGGSYLFLWLMGFRPLVAALGSVLVGFTTYIPIIIGAGHNTKFLTYSFIPWMLAGYWMISRTNRIWLAFFLLTIATNLVLRSNHPQVLYFFFFVLLIWWIYDLSQAWRNGELPPFVKKSVLIGSAGLLALVANADEYWTTFEYTPYSTRGGSEITEEADAGSGLDPDYAFAWSQGPGELLTLIIPESYGGASGEGTYWGPKSFTSGPHYFGAITLLLIVIALFNVRARLMYVFGASALLTILFSLGKHLEWFNMIFFNYFPLFDRFRVPEMWLMVSVFCAAIVALYGLNWLYEQYENNKLDLSSFYAPGGIVLAIALIFAVGSGQILSFEKEGEREQIAMQIAQQQQMDPQDPQVMEHAERVIAEQFIPAREEKAASDSRRFLIFVLIGGGLIAATLAGKLAVSYAAAGILLLTAVDLIQVGERYAEKDDLISADIEHTQIIEDRMTSADEFIRDNVSSDEAWSYRGYPLASNPFNNAVPASYLYESLGGYSGAKLQNFQDLVDHAINQDPQRAPVPILSMMNVRYVTAQQQLQDPAFELVHQQQDGIVFENTEVLPRTFFVDEIEYAGSPREAMNAINRDGFDPSELAILQTDNEITIDPEAQPASEVTRLDNRNIEVDIESDGDAFMVLSEVYYPAGWNAELDGEPIDIERTNFLLRGFQIPEGSHTLTLRLEPASHIWGGRLSWIFNIFILLIGGVAAYQEWNRRKQQEN